MHTALVGTTYIVIMLLGLFICIIGSGWDENTNLEKDDGETVRPWGLLWLIPLVGILFLFAKTSSCPDFDEIAKTSKKNGILFIPTTSMQTLQFQQTTSP